MISGQEIFRIALAVLFVGVLIPVAFSNLYAATWGATPAWISGIVTLLVALGAAGAVVFSLVGKGK